ncbi:hypothetical protein [Methylobacterium organophilum]|uniref:Uncharacterized protein n=1 Tax=Methylobacterium organophilum TaxID=410 RepID=A0ABQ4T1U1_METOR|nr:hypothetical protein [Methylobacterium organophilum]GJE25602.1 hypothetical protein LKMONMHP_0440 [Methylobacterium organophilum]
MIADRIATNRVCIANVFYGGRDFEALSRGRDPEEVPPASDA